MADTDGAPGPAILTPALAQGIAGDTSTIIGYNVLITDRDGMVIGSGDTSRLGTFHEASVPVIRTQEAAAHSAGQARRLRGVRPGVTLPIVIDGDAVGSVGITGSPAQVKRFGQVVKRQTETLLQESLLLRSRLLRERAVEDLLREIAYFDPDVVAAEDLLARAAELGYDLRSARVAVLADIGSGQRIDAAPRVIRETLADSRALVATVAPGRVAVFHLTRERPVRDLLPTCRTVADALSHKLSVPVRIGIGTSASSVAELRDSYEDAAAALRFGPTARPGTNVHTIEDLRIHRLVAAVPPRTRARFTTALLPALQSRPDWPVLRRTIIAWCENGFSLVRTATALNIHRNTLIYRLHKIADLSGHSSHDHRAELALYLACIADQMTPD